MKRSKFTDRQIAVAPGGRESAGCGGVPQDGYQRSDLLRVEEEVRRTEPSEVRKLRHLQEENQRLKRIVADLSLDREMLQEVILSKL